MSHLRDLRGLENTCKHWVNTLFWYNKHLVNICVHSAHSSVQNARTHI